MALTVAPVLTTKISEADKEENLEEWAQPFLENENKYNLLSSCLEVIKEVKPDDNLQTINSLLNDLDYLKDFSNYFIRKIGRIDKRINSQLTLQKLSKIIFYHKEISLHYLKNKNDIVLFNQLFFYYKFNLLYDKMIWPGTKGCKKSKLKSLSWLRNIKLRNTSLN